MVELNCAQCLKCAERLNAGATPPPRCPNACLEGRQQHTRHIFPDPQYATDTSLRYNSRVAGWSESLGTDLGINEVLLVWSLKASHTRPATFSFGQDLIKVADELAAPPQPGDTTH